MPDACILMKTYFKNVYGYMTTTKVLHPSFTFERGTFWKENSNSNSILKIDFLNANLWKPILKMFMAIWPLQKFYIPIIILTMERFEKKIRILSDNLDFENLGFKCKSMKTYF